jgi:hypothetical protein
MAGRFLAGTQQAEIQYTFLLQSTRGGNTPVLKSPIGFPPHPSQAAKMKRIPFNPTFGRIGKLISPDGADMLSNPVSMYWVLQTEWGKSTLHKSSMVSTLIFRMSEMSDC